MKRKAYFEKVKGKMKSNIKFTIFMTVIALFLSPFVLLIFLRLILSVGIYIGDITGLSVVDIDQRPAISIGDYIYYYSQLLLAIGTIALTSLLVFFSAREYMERYKKEFSVDFEISNIIYVVSAKTEMLMHLPITFVNLSKRSGWISKVICTITDSEDKPITQLESTFFVNIKNNYSIKHNSDHSYVDQINNIYDDGLPFTNIPLKSQEVIREFITLSQEQPLITTSVFNSVGDYKLVLLMQYGETIKDKNEKVEKVYNIKIEQKLIDNFESALHDESVGNRTILKLSFE